MKQTRKITRIIMLALAAALFSACGTAAPAAPTKVTEASAPTPPAATASLVPEATAPVAAPVQPTDEPAAPAVSVETPAPPAETPAPTEEPAPEPVGPDVPEREAVDDSYFEDAAFFGNSLVRGLDMFGGLDDGEFFAATSANVISVGMTRDSQTSDGSPATLLQALEEKQYRKIYLLFGINEIGFNTDSFVSLYGGVLDEIAAAQPDAQLYIMSLTPITEKRSASDDVFKRERVEEFNERLYALAEERGCYYLDIYSALADENGWLPSEHSTDGIHFTAEKYPEWADYLRTHYVPQDAE